MRGRHVLRMIARTARVGVLFLLLSVAVLAAGPRIALIRVLEGEAQVDNRAVVKATFLHEGQLLQVGADSQVLIQLLGSSGEVKIDGPKDLPISKADLNARSSDVLRGGVRVTSDIGNVNEIGAQVFRNSRPGARTAQTPDTLQLKPVLPPTRTEHGWEIGFAPNGLEIPSSGMIEYTVKKGAEVVKSGEFTGFFQPIKLAAEEISEGEDLTLEIKYYAHLTQIKSTYVRDFRVLTSEDSQLLQAAKEIFLDDYFKGDLIAMFRLVDLYTQYHQVEPALDYLRKARQDLDQPLPHSTLKDYPPDQVDSQIAKLESLKLMSIPLD